MQAALERIYNGQQHWATYMQVQGSLEFARRNDHGVALTRTPNGIGWLLREMGDIGEAIEFDRDNVEVARRAGAAEGESNALCHLTANITHVRLRQVSSEPMRSVRRLPAQQRNRPRTVLPLIFHTPPEVIHLDEA